MPEGPYLLGRGGGIRTHGLFVPNFAQKYRGAVDVPIVLG
jgi:hypothetical protein